MDPRRLCRIKMSFIRSAPPYSKLLPSSSVMRSASWAISFYGLIITASDGNCMWSLFKSPNTSLLVRLSRLRGSSARTWRGLETRSRADGGHAACWSPDRVARHTVSFVPEPADALTSSMNSVYGYRRPALRAGRYFHRHCRTGQDCRFWKINGHPVACGKMRSCRRSKRPAPALI